MWPLQRVVHHAAIYSLPLTHAHNLYPAYFIEQEPARI